LLCAMHCMLCLRIRKYIHTQGFRIYHTHAHTHTHCLCAPLVAFVCVFVCVCVCLVGGFMSKTHEAPLEFTAEGTMRARKLLPTE